MFKHVLKEGSASFEPCEGIFYNPYMRLSRSLSVSILRAYKHLVNKDEPLTLLDAFTATGIRGLRYAVEADYQVDFLDFSAKAVECASKNLSLNSIKGQVFDDDFVAFSTNEGFKSKYDAVELDPFGSPVPFLWPALYMLSSKKRAILSFTATDGPVLCGVQGDAAKKYYQSHIPHNSFCHETGLRVLMKKAALTAAEFNFAFKPLASFYYRHQWKVIAELEKSHEGVMETLTHISTAEDPFTKKHYGPIWTGPLFDEEILAKASSDDKQAEKYLNLFREEYSLTSSIPYHYSLPAIIHGFSIKGNMPSLSSILKTIKEKGYRGTKTHFSPQALRTNMPISDFVELLRELSIDNGS